MLKAVEKSSSLYMYVKLHPWLFMTYHRQYNGVTWEEHERSGVFILTLIRFFGVRADPAKIEIVTLCYRKEWA